MECELPEFYQWAEPVARKQHRCCECKAPIEKGEKHFYCTGKWDDQIQSFRQHLLCAQACMFIRDKLNGGDCICFGGLWEWVDEAKWQCDRSHPVWQELRRMLAAIKWRERRMEMTDNINHPPHYTAGTIEVIDAIEDWQLGFHLGNVVKYVARCAHKGNKLDDLRKASWYLQRHIARLENGCENGGR